MTGYSSSRAEDGDFAVAVSLKSINHRFLDLQFRLPSELVFFEPKARGLLRERILRGHVEATASFERAGENTLRLDQKALGAYLEACRAVRKEFGDASELDLVGLLRIPGVVDLGSEVLEEERRRLEAILEKTFLQAIEKLNEMRETEGRALARDLEARLKRLEELGLQISDLARSAVGAFHERLENRIRELIKGPEPDASRLAQEVALLSVRSDVTEEITRFCSHVSQAQLLLKEEKEIGKKLDFLLQEMNREANTLLSKTTDVPAIGMKIAESAIEMKVEIEKLREQAQNIE